MGGLFLEGLLSRDNAPKGVYGYIFRFVSILGERYTHGHIFDFYRQILDDPAKLTVLGDGTQRKSYLYIQDCISAMLRVISAATAASAKHRSIVYNLGTNEYCTVKDSISWISNHLGVQPKLEFTGGSKGWIGDNPFIFLETKRIRETGWKPTLTIRESVIRTLEWLMENQWVFQRR